MIWNEMIINIKIILWMYWCDCNVFFNILCGLLILKWLKSLQHIPVDILLMRIYKLVCYIILIYLPFPNLFYIFKTSSLQITGMNMNIKVHEYESQLLLQSILQAASFQP